MSTRPIPLHQTSARLIYQAWQAKMCEIGQGHMVYDWDYIPYDVKEAWEDVISSHLNRLNENTVKGIAERLAVPVNVRCDRPHR